MSPTIIPVIQTWGTKQHLRYIITDTTGRYWTGSGWATRQRDALLYAGHHDAAAAAHRILWKQFQRRHTVYQLFCLPLEMQVFAQAEVTAGRTQRLRQEVGETVGPVRRPRHRADTRFPGAAPSELGPHDPTRQQREGARLS